MTAPLTDAELAEIEAQLISVTRGPWNWLNTPHKEAIQQVFAELRRLRAEVAVLSVLNEVGKVAAQVLADREAELRRLREMRCETCAEWERYPCDEWGVGELTEHPGGLSEQRPQISGKCRLSDRKNVEETQGREVAFYAEDADRYWAWLCTAPDFGCNKWEARP